MNAQTAPVDLPLFPLQTVLFPGGLLPLKIFEPRYMDMISECMKAEKPFGVCLISEGKEVGAPAIPHLLGTTARIRSWDMPQSGLLHVTVQGERRFRILGCQAEANGLIRGKVSLLAEAPVVPVSDDHLGAVFLLKAIAADQSKGRIAEPHAFEDADWVGMRLAEVLPIPMLARQKLLELDDPEERMGIIVQFLNQKGLVK